MSLMSLSRGHSRVSRDRRSPDTNVRPSGKCRRSDPVPRVGAGLKKLSQKSVLRRNRCTIMIAGLVGGLDVIRQVVKRQKANLTTGATAGLPSSGTHRSILSRFFLASGTSCAFGTRTQWRPGHPA